MAAVYAEILHIVNHESSPNICIAGNLRPSDVRGMPKTLYKKQIGDRLRIAIEAVGETQAEVCRKFDVAPPKLGNWLRGDNYPDPWFVKRFCDRYGITTDWIYREVASGSSATVADALWARTAEVASTVESASSEE